MAKLKETETERWARAEAAKAFYRELQKYRRDRESLRAMAMRLDIDPTSLIQWERGASVTPHLIRRIVDALCLPDSEFYRLLAVAEPAAPPYVQADTVPLYDSADLRVQAGQLTGASGGTVTLGHDWPGYESGRGVIALRYDSDDMAPTIPRGSIAVVNTAKTLDPRSVISGYPWLVTKKPRGGHSRVTLRCLATYDGKVWLLPLHAKPESPWTSDLAALVVGRVVLVVGDARVDSGELEKRLEKSLSRKR